MYIDFFGYLQIISNEHIQNLTCKFKSVIVQIIKARNSNDQTTKFTNTKRQMRYKKRGYMLNNVLKIIIDIF